MAPRAWARLLVLGALLAPRLTSAVAPGDLVVAEDQSGVFGFASSLSSIDPDSGAFTTIPTGFEFQFAPLDVAAGRNGTIAGLFQTDEGGFVGLFYRDASGAGLEGGSSFSASHRVALEVHGDLLIDAGTGLARYRARYGFDQFLQFLSPGNVSEIAVGPSGEIYVWQIASGGGSSVQSVDPVTGVRTLLTNQSLFPIVVEDSGDLIGFDSASNLVRVDVPTGAVSVVASLGFRGGVGIGPDGRIFVAVGESATGAGDGFIARVDPVTGAPTTQPLARGLGRVAGFAVVNCTVVDGACVVEPQCSEASTCDDGNFCTGVDVCNTDGLCERGPDACPLGGDCDEPNDNCFCTGGIPCGDGLACNGVETCSNPSGGTCLPGTPLCPPDQFCVEPGTCLDCVEDAHCDDGLACNGAETCNGGTCQAGAPLCPGQVCVEPGSCFECVVDADCDDGLACNGAETCSGNACQPGAPLCPSEQFCVEPGSCVECLVDLDCDDGQFCNGAESCSAASSCDAGVFPCLAGQTCNEAADACEPALSGDLDITRFAAPSRVRTGDTATLTLKLRGGASPSTGIVTVTGVQNGTTILDDTRVVVAAPGQRITESYAVPIGATGTIAWTATIEDADPDADVAVDETSVTR